MEITQGGSRLALLKHVQAFLPQDQFNEVLALLRDNPGELTDAIYAQVHRLMREHYLFRDSRIGVGFESNLECLARLYPQLSRRFIGDQLEMFHDLPDHLVVVHRVLLSAELKREAEQEIHDYAKLQGKRASPYNAAEVPAKKSCTVSTASCDMEDMLLNWSAETEIWPGPSQQECLDFDLVCSVQGNEMPVPESAIVTELIDNIVEPVVVKDESDLALGVDVPEQKVENNNTPPLAVTPAVAKENLFCPISPPTMTSETADFGNSDHEVSDFDCSYYSDAVDDDMWTPEEEFDLVSHLVEVTGLDRPKIVDACWKHNINIMTRPDGVNYNALMDTLLEPHMDGHQQGPIPVVDITESVSPPAPAQKKYKTIDLTSPVHPRSSPLIAAVPPPVQTGPPPRVIKIGQPPPPPILIAVGPPPVQAGQSFTQTLFSYRDPTGTVTSDKNINNGEASTSRTCISSAPSTTTGELPTSTGVPRIVISPPAAGGPPVTTAVPRIATPIDSSSSAKITITQSNNTSASAFSNVDTRSAAVTVNDKIDTKLVNRLCEIFPDAAPDYIRNISKGRVMENGAVDDLITVILDANGAYPKRPPRQPDPEISVADQFTLLNELLPDADPDYLRMLCDRHKDRPDQLKIAIDEAIERRNYPSKKEYQRRQQLSAQQKQYTTEFKVEEFLKVIPNPDEFFADPNRAGVSKLDLLDLTSHYALISLRNRYDRLPVRHIQQTFSACSRKYLDACKQLDSINSNSRNWIKTRRKPTPLPNNITNIPLLQEIAYVEHRDEIRALLEQRKLEELSEIQQAKAMNLMVTCQCCYDEEVLPKNLFKCPNGCSFCRACIVKSTEVLFGEGKVDFPCLTNCQAVFGLQVLRAALTPKFFSKVAQKKTMAEVKAAGIEDLETCPFCDFATIPPEGDKIFSCLNPECMKQSCRLCKEPSHIPLRCEEIEKDDDVKARVFMENKMTEALLRKCYKCGIKFYKEEGCNKMTCSCGAMMCYVCNQPVTDYNHFNGQGGDRYHLCPLYSDTNQLHQENVMKGVQEARAQLGDKELKVDPTKDLANHFKKRPVTNQQTLLARLEELRGRQLGRAQQAIARAGPNANLAAERAQLRGFIDVLAALNERLEGAPGGPPHRRQRHHHHRDHDIPDF